MPTITITIDDTDQAIDEWAYCAHRYGLNRVDIHNGLEPEVVPETDPTPPHGTPRPTPRTKKPQIVSVPCPTCGADVGVRCRTDRGGSYTGYDYGHTARTRARDAAWKQTQA